MSTRWLVGAVGIETTHAWHFNDLRSRARTEKEGLGSPWNPYCREPKPLLGEPPKIWGAVDRPH
jgi:hypothetical protein